MAADTGQTQRSAAWAQSVDFPEEWASAHQWLLDAVFALFDRDGDWPKITSVQRAISAYDTQRAVAVGQLATDIHSELGAREGDRFALTMRALSHCPGAADLLSHFVATIRLAADTYRAAGDEDAVLSGLLIKQRLGLDDATYIKLSRLIFRESWFFGSGGGNPDEDWHFDILVSVLLAERIENIDDYLEVLARHRFGPPVIEAPRAPTRNIQLQREWEIGEQIGAGGFGRVMLATSDDEQAVAKFIPKTRGAERELLFVDLGSARNVVPIIDHGETDDSWVLVMPRADKNLRQYMDDEGPTLGADVVRVILADIAMTLVDLADTVVHRDLKPENVLRSRVVIIVAE